MRHVTQGSGDCGMRMLLQPCQRVDEVATGDSLHLRRCALAGSSSLAVASGLVCGLTQVRWLALKVRHFRNACNPSGCGWAGAAALQVRSPMEPRWRGNYGEVGKVGESGPMELAAPWVGLLIPGQAGASHLRVSVSNRHCEGRVCVHRMKP